MHIFFNALAQPSTAAALEAAATLATLVSDKSASARWRRLGQHHLACGHAAEASRAWSHAAELAPLALWARVHAGDVDATAAVAAAGLDAGAAAAAQLVLNQHRADAPAPVRALAGTANETARDRAQLT